VKACEKRVSVWLGPRHCERAGNARAARLVLDDDGRTAAFADLHPEDTGYDICNTPWRNGHDDGNRLRRVLLCARLMHPQQQKQGSRWAKMSNPRDLHDRHPSLAQQLAGLLSTI
jgi:hypothetical protein